MPVWNEYTVTFKDGTEETGVKAHRIDWRWEPGHELVLEILPDRGERREVERVTVTNRDVGPRE